MTTDRKSAVPTRTLFWCELVCTNCNTTTAGRWVSESVPRRSMKREAQGQGWVFEGTEAYCCEAHRKAWHQQQALLAKMAGHGPAYSLA